MYDKSATRMQRLPVYCFCYPECHPLDSPIVLFTLLYTVSGSDLILHIPLFPLLKAPSEWHFMLNDIHPLDGQQ